MNMQEYKDISKVYKEETFKKQIITRCLFHCSLILFFPFMDFIHVNVYISWMVFVLWGYVGYTVMERLERKGIFIERKYFHESGYRIVYLILFIWLCFLAYYKDIDTYSTWITLFFALSIPIEILACYKEYKKFKNKMIFFKNNGTIETFPSSNL